MNGVELEITTGKEWHTSYGAYGKVQVLQENGELEYHWKLAGCDTNWDGAVEVGSHGKHGKWIPSWLVLPEGTLIYVEGASTWRGHTNEKGRGWFEVSAAADLVSVTTPGYNVRNLEVRGNLRRLGYAEMKERGLTPAIRASKHLSVEVAA